jgi:iron complex outermembrane receptor protein
MGLPVAAAEPSGPAPEPGKEPATLDVRPAADAKPIVKPAPDAKQQIKGIEVNARRASTTDERRESAAAKIIFGREDIERYGDTQLADVLRRLPSVTVSSNGGISLRGMGAGYTQILIDGERVAPGFAIDQLSPDLVERIEILRAPTAETGARAIAGTINIILRKPSRKREDDMKLGTNVQNHRISEDGSLSRNDALGFNGTYNLTATARESRSTSPFDSHLTGVDTRTDALVLDRRFDALGLNHTAASVVSGQAQWKWANGNEWMLQPFLQKSHVRADNRDTLTQAVGPGPAPYARDEGSFAGKFEIARLNTTVGRRLDDATRLEWRAGSGLVRRQLDSADNEFDTAGVRFQRQTYNTHSRDFSWSSSVKLIHTASETARLVAGLELEGVKRRDDTTVLLNGAPQVAEFGGELDVSTRRRAAYLQTEWDPAKDWSANLGARWEGFETHGNTGGAKNSSSVFTPLAHAVWRFNAPAKDQLRLSVTQSYQTPALYSLITRPRLDAVYPVPGPNTAANTDYAGNLGLRPERAHGLDLAYEHYLAGGGVLSVNFFSRRIHDIVRDVTALETVSWATSPRYVQRPRNLGNATSSGIEFDAKFQLPELITGAPPIDVRANVNVFDSRVDSVPGPNNRLRGQPRAKCNFGADYRFRSLPVTIGGTAAYTPAVTVQTTPTQQEFNASDRTLGAYALWTLSPGNKLRFTVSNLLPRAAANSTTVVADGQRQATYFPGSAYSTIGLRWELRL